MDCERARALFSDHLEGRLDPSLRRDLHDHLVSCGACAALRAAFGEVVDALRCAPELPVPLGLVERVVEATRRLPRHSALRSPRMPLWMQAAAAVVALALTGGVLALRQPHTQAGLARLWQRTQRFGVYVAERRERAVEELRLLRIVVGTAFEGRLDRVNERVEDYRQLLERRRASEQAAPAPAPPKAPQGGNFPNSGSPRRVYASEDAPERPETTRRSVT
jgi:anti-sigma factor RsiW